MAAGPAAGLRHARLRPVRVSFPAVVVADPISSPAGPRPLTLGGVTGEGETDPRLAAAGGPVVPEWETPPPEWTREFHGLLALP